MVARAAAGPILRIYRRLPHRTRRFFVRTLTPNYAVGALCVIERSDGAVLLVRHSYRTKWGVPGGLAARHEHPSRAAVREAREEVGLAIELTAPPEMVVDATIGRIDVIFAARPIGDPLVARPVSPEIVDVQWFATDALPELQDEAAGALVAVARRRHSDIGLGPATA